MIRGAVGENRTPNLLITNQLLYQLSYNGLVNINVGSNLRPDILGLSYFPKYLFSCFLSVVSPSNVETFEPPCCVDNDNHQVSVCSKPTCRAKSTVSSSNVLYCFVLATFKAKCLPFFKPLNALAIVCFKNFSFHISLVLNLILDCSGSSP